MRGERSQLILQEIFDDEKLQQVLRREKAIWGFRGLT
jgi:hypothetical protein